MHAQGLTVALNTIHRRRCFVARGNTHDVTTASLDKIFGGLPAGLDVVGHNPVSRHAGNVAVYENDWYTIIDKLHHLTTEARAGRRIEQAINGLGAHHVELAAFAVAVFVATGQTIFDFVDQVRKTRA